MNESWPWCEVYEIIHIWTAVVDESEEWSSQWIFQFKQLERRSLKKIRTSCTFWTAVFIRLPALSAFGPWKWALIKFSTFSASMVCLFCNKTINGNNKTRRCKVSVEYSEENSVFGEVSHYYFFNLGGGGRGGRGKGGGRLFEFQWLRHNLEGKYDNIRCNQSSFFWCLHGKKSYTFNDLWLNQPNVYNPM